VWVAVAAATVAIVAVLVTGFVAPGFLLPGDSHPEIPASGPVAADPSVAVPPTTGEASTTAEEFVAKLNAGDTDGAAALACVGSESIVGGQLLLAVEPPTSLTVGVQLSAQEMGRQRFVKFEMTGSTKQRDVNGTIQLQVLPDAPPCVRVLSFGAVP
jgi:hypothetical protein